MVDQQSLYELQYSQKTLFMSSCVSVRKSENLINTFLDLPSCSQVISTIIMFIKLLIRFRYLIIIVNGFVRKSLLKQLENPKQFTNNVRPCHCPRNLERILTIRPLLPPMRICPNRLTQNLITGETRGPSWLEKGAQKKFDLHLLFSPLVVSWSEMINLLRVH
jgi:hypothetical protein